MRKTHPNGKKSYAFKKQTEYILFILCSVQRKDFKIIESMWLFTNYFNYVLTEYIESHLNESQQHFNSNIFRTSHPFSTLVIQGD